MKYSVLLYWRKKICHTISRAGLTRGIIFRGFFLISFDVLIFRVSSMNKKIQHEILHNKEYFRNFKKKIFFYINIFVEKFSF